MLYDAKKKLQKVIVTGGEGFIGKSLVAKLEKERIEVVSLSRRNGYNVLNDSVDLSNVNHIFHLAGQTFVPDSWINPEAFFKTNSLGTFRLLDQCKNAGNISVTYISAYTYGSPKSLPVKETDQIFPNNPYAFSKAMGENVCRFYSDIYGLSVSVLRLFNVYGPGQSSSFLIPRVINQILDDNIKEIVIDNIIPRRDYIYIDDAIEAIILSAQLNSFQILNVGSGVSYSVGDIIDRCIRLCGKPKIILDQKKIRKNEIMDVVADISKISDLTGWRPVTSIDFGLKTMIEEKKNEVC